MHLTDINRRLMSVEEKIDMGLESSNKLAVSVARVEERQIKSQDDNTVLGKEVKDLSARVGKLESQNAVQDFTLGKGERLFWLSMTVFVGLLVSGVAN